MVTSRLKSWICSLSGYTISAILLIHILVVPILYKTIMDAYRDNSYEQFISHSRSVSGLLADAISAKSISQNMPYINHILDSALLGGDIVFIELVHKSGVISATDSVAAKPRQFIEDEIVGGNGDGTYYITIPVYFTASNNISALNIGFDETPIIEKFDALRLRLRYIIAIYLAFVIAFFSLSVRIIHRPLRALRQQSQGVVNGDTETPLEICS
ncbi:MAG: hypothetical protein IME93_06290, partial [Proteobacteria bacterium]|nr:hypothetical protein [Pseudomonadota bacterium]